MSTIYLVLADVNIHNQNIKSLFFGILDAAGLLKGLQYRRYYSFRDFTSSLVDYFVSNGP